MSSVGYDTWYKKESPTVFRVENIAENGKRIRLFKYPIKNGMVRDLMEIPYVSEADIRHSLLKGELYIKIISNEIRIVESNIDLLQFDSIHKQFLINAGIINGLEVTGSGGTLNFSFREEVSLVGPKNNSNRTFTIPNGEKFLEGTYSDSEFHIQVFHNGRNLIQNVDFIISESGGVGTGYDLIKIISFVPSQKSQLVANYVVANA